MATEQLYNLTLKALMCCAMWLTSGDRDGTTELSASSDEELMSRPRTLS